MRKPFYRKDRKAWFVRTKSANGKDTQSYLASNEGDAYRIWERDFRSVDNGEAKDRVTTIGVVISTYVADMETRLALGQLAKATVERRTFDLLSFLASDSNDEITIEELKPFHVKDWVNSQDTWNATTRHYAAGTVKRAVKWAFDEGRITNHVLRGLKVEKGEARDHLVTHDEWNAIYNELRFKKNLRFRSFLFYLMALRLTGCRPSEVTDLRIEHLQSDHTWHLPKHKTRRKTRKPRVVVPCPCARTLVLMARGDRMSGPVFQAALGEEFTYNAVRLRFERLRDRLGLTDELVLYSFRHTYITDALVAGVDIGTVAELTGTSVQMIAQHYGHLDQKLSHLQTATATVARKQPKAK